MGDRGRLVLVGRLGIRPSAGQVVRDVLDEVFEALEDAGRGRSVAVLDAGCGRVSALKPYRTRIARFVGADIHAPGPDALPYLDEFATVDLCIDADAFPPASFDLILSSFTLEHFADPDAAVRNLRRWLRPHGRLVLTTVNRGHPFVAGYLRLPVQIRAPLQRLVKAYATDAHPLVGACNDPGLVRSTLERAGFEQVRVRTVGHLARAWGRHWPTYLLGLLGDLAMQPIPDRRSTIVADAVAPAAPLAN